MSPPSPSSPSDADFVLVAVPSDLRSHAPDGAVVVAFDPRTLAVDPTGLGESAAGGSLPAPFPSGRAGVATVLLCETLESLALRRADATALVEAAEAAGGDPLATLDRLADAAARGEIDPAFDVDRRRQQLASFLE